MTKKGAGAALSDVVQMRYQCHSRAWGFISKKNLLLTYPQSTRFAQTSPNFVKNCYVCSGTQVSFAINFFVSKWTSMFSSPFLPRDVVLRKYRLEFDFSPPQKLACKPFQNQKLILTFSNFLKKISLGKQAFWNSVVSFLGAITHLKKCSFHYEIENSLS